MSGQIAELERRTVTVPVWATAKEVQALYGLPPFTLRRLADRGKVRFVKLGRSVQSGRIFRVGDIEELLEQHTNDVLEVDE